MNIYGDKDWRRWRMRQTDIEGTKEDKTKKG